MNRDRDTAMLLNGIGAKIRSIRRERKISVRELAKLAQLSPRFINQLESGEANIAIAGLARLAAALGRSPSEFILPTETDDSRRARIQRWLYESDDGDLKDLAQWIDSRGQPFSKQSPRFIALIGLRGVGKSTVGAILAKRMKRQFVELDQWIETAAGMKMAEVFATHGESYYRRLERQSLDRLFSSSGAFVFAPGGSVVTDEYSWTLIRRTCFTIWLHATADEYVKRMRKQGDLRPMQGRPSANTELKALLSRREPLYAESDLCVKTTGKSPSSIASEIVKALHPSINIR